MSSVNREFHSQTASDQEVSAEEGFVQASAGSEDSADFGPRVLAEFEEIGPQAEPFQVELVMSELAGEWWEVGEDRTTDLIEFAGDESSPSAAAALSALAELALTEAQRQDAAKALSTMVSQGVSAPEWASKIGNTSVGECWKTSDIYGDSSSLLCLFGQGADAHAVLTLLDFTEHAGWAKDVAIVERPEEVLAEMREQTQEGDGLVLLEQVSLAEAARLIETGILATDRLNEPEVGPDFARFRMLAMARVRALKQAAGEDVSVAVEAEPRIWSEAERQSFVDMFLKETGTTADESSRSVLRALVDYGCDHEPARPLRVGPEKLALFLELLIDGEIEFEQEIPEDLGDTILAWARWSATRDGLPEFAITALVDALEDLMEELGGAEEESSEFDPYLDDLEEPLDGEELSELLERRTFAIPSVYTEIRDEELELEPSDPEQRQLLVLGEHPEYHEAIAADELTDESRMHLVVKTTVIDQLWENDPPEVWEAAQRMLVRGMQREEILEKLGAQLAPHLRATDDELLEFDPDDYSSALSVLS